MTFITSLCPVRSSWRPQRDHATTGLLQEVPEAIRRSIFLVSQEGARAPGRQIVPTLPHQLTLLRLARHKRSVERISLKTKRQGQETFRIPVSQTENGSFTKLLLDWT